MKCRIKTVLVVEVDVPYNRLPSVLPDQLVTIDGSAVEQTVITRDVNLTVVQPTNAVVAFRELGAELAPHMPNFVRGFLQGLNGDLSTLHEFVKKSKVDV